MSVPQINVSDAAGGAAGMNAEMPAAANVEACDGVGSSIGVDASDAVSLTPSPVPFILEH